MIIWVIWWLFGVIIWLIIWWLFLIICFLIWSLFDDYLINYLLIICDYLMIIWLELFVIICDYLILIIWWLFVDFFSLFAIIWWLFDPNYLWLFVDYLILIIRDYSWLFVIIWFLGQQQVGCLLHSQKPSHGTAWWWQPFACENHSQRVGNNPTLILVITQH